MTPHFVERERRERFTEADAVRRRMNCYVQVWPSVVLALFGAAAFRGACFDRGPLDDRPRVARGADGPGRIGGDDVEPVQRAVKSSARKGSHDSAWSGSVGTARMSAGRIR